MLFADINTLPSVLSCRTQTPTRFHIHYSPAAIRCSPPLPYGRDIRAKAPDLNCQHILLPFPGHGPVFVVSVQWTCAYAWETEALSGESRWQWGLPAAMQDRASVGMVLGGKEREGTPMWASSGAALPWRGQVWGWAWSGWAEMSSRHWRPVESHWRYLVEIIWE